MPPHTEPEATPLTPPQTQQGPEIVPVLKHAAASGVKWTSLAHAARMGLHLLTTSVFALLLTPADFGLLGMAMVVVGFVTVFKDLGTGAAVVQSREADEETLSTLFWANCAFGLLAGAALVLLAPAVGGFFREPRLIPILQVLALSLPLSGPGIVSLALLQRDLRFNVLARVEIAAVVGGSAVGLCALFLGAGLWSLVLMTVTVALLSSGLAFLSGGFRPRAVFRPRKLRDVAGFSLNLTGFQVFHWLTRNVDHLLIGRFLGATQLGYYALAYRLVLYPLQSVSGVVGRVMFPLLSRIKDDDPRFRNAYLRVTAAVATVLFPVFVGLFLVFSGPLVGDLFGKWRPAAPLIAVFALVAVLQSVGSTTGPIYQAKGRTDLLLRWGLFAGCATIGAFALGLQWGTYGVAAAFGLATLLLSYHGLTIPLRLIGLRIGELLSNLRRPALATLLMAAATAAFQLSIADAGLGPIVQLALVVGFGVVAYVVACLAVNGPLTRDALALLLGRKEAA